MKTWRIKKEPTEIYNGWCIYFEYTRTYGMTTGQEDFRARAQKNNEEIYFEPEEYKSQHKVRQKIKEIIDNFEAYNITLS